MNTGSRDEQQFLANIQGIARSLNRIANCMEAQEMRARDKLTFDPKSLGALALWREEVARGDCRIGFADWLAWHEHDEEAGTSTTPEEIEALAPAVAAVKRGFADLEQAQREQREGKG